MTDTEISDKVKQATRTTLEEDLWLLINNTSEQSISHKIAYYLQQLFIDFDVDCEYNGDIDSPGSKKTISILKSELKYLKLIRPSEETDLEREFTIRAVFPDIIIHKRGTNERNLCIIEVKKSTSTIPYEFDFLKLKAYTSDQYNNNLKYQLGVFIEVIISPEEPSFEFSFFKDGHDIDKLI